MADWLRRRWRLWLLLLAVAALAWFGTPHARAWYRLRQGRDALTRHRPQEAREHLELCLSDWPTSIEARLLASRAARRVDDHEAADRHVRACRKTRTTPSADVVREWALLQASTGNFREVEDYLHRLSQRHPPSSPLVWEAMVEGYIRVYRILDALQCLDHWLKVAPDDLRALELRGQAFRQGNSSHKAAEDFRRILELDPDRDDIRWYLALCLLDMGSYTEAVELLARLRKQRPEDIEIQTRLARCYKMLDRSSEAQQMLDAILAEHPEHAHALRTRGQLALLREGPAAAVPYLRRAVQARPDDYQSRWLLFQSYSQQGLKAEADDAMKQAERLRDRLEKLGDIRSRKMSEQPLDPALHVEMASLLMRSGREELGEKWMLSALTLDPNFAPAHVGLAEYYRKKGDTRRADDHAARAKRRAEPAPK